MAQQKVKINLPPGYDPETRERIGLDIIDFIRFRAQQQNTGFNPSTGRNKKFVRYSKAYAEQKGVSRSDVDLVLDGDMLDDIEVLTDTSTSVTIGYVNGTESNAKAEGNQKGSYGRAPNPGNARPFLGLTKADLNRILEKYDSE